MKNYYGVYKNQDGVGWAWREATYPDDVVALSKMRILALKKTLVVDGETKERMSFYDLDYLLCGKRVIFNG